MQQLGTISTAARRMTAMVALAFSGLIAACDGTHVTEWHAESGYRWRELPDPGRGTRGFTHIPASRTGVTSTNRFTEAQLIENQHLLNGSGVALGDMDGDGWVDLFLSRLAGPNALYRNLGGWRFEDVTDGAGVSAPDRYATGAAFADTDGDGDLDLLVTALGGPNTLYLNDGAGRFRDAGPAAGLHSTRGSHTIALADVDGDGDLDLYVANYKVKTVKDLFPPDARAFDRVVRAVGDGFEVAPEFREHYRVERQGNRLARLEIGEPDVLYLNDGAGRFLPVDFTDGRFLDEDGRPLTEAPTDWGLTARFYDADLDGDPDLYVTNDFESVDRFWLNDGSGRFRAAPRLALRTLSQSSMAVDFSDLDRDGDLDFFTADMLSRDPRRRRTQMALTPAEMPALGVFDDRPQRQRNALFRNRNDGTYEEVAPQAGLAASGWSWGSAFLDVDLDGFEDLLIANGYANDALDGDTQRRVSQRQAGRDWRRDVLEFPPLALPNAAFRNHGDFTFEDVSREWGFGTEPDISHGLATADLDRDGDLDVVLNRQDAPPAIYRNNAPAPRLAVRLRGRAPNTQAVGARISVTGGPGGVQTKEVTAGGMYLSHSDPLSVFATGAADRIRIEVRWRAGHITELDAYPNRLYEITEPTRPAEPTASAPSNESPPPVFRDATATLNHRHTETDYVDFNRQPLLPNRLSQLGPGVTWYDVDRDGDDDLLVGAGRGGTLAHYRNDADGFTPVARQTTPAPFDQTTVLPLRIANGSVQLLVGQMNYEARTPAEAIAAPAVLRVPVGPGAVVVDAAVPGDRSSVGPMALADYDDDGDLDLFVGGRTVPAGYPTAPRSRLFRNNDGNFIEDGTVARLLRGVGMVSSALFTDLDTDGDPDLVLAIEWGPVRILENRNGRFADVTAAWGLDQLSGRWNGVASGDLNADGRPDLVATNWGRNTLFEASEERPLDGFYADFDNNGTLDFLAAQRDEGREGLRPLADLMSLMTAMPSLQRRIGGFAEFADATIDDLLGPAVARAGRVRVTTFDHVALLNRGDRFEVVPLPPAAQVAPSFFAGVTDFDGDGHDDVFLSHNFFPTRAEAERYDAGRGLWLRGDGAGHLTAVPGAESGVAVYGDQRGAAFTDYDRDGRIDLAVSQNAAATVLYHNETATPGVRVRLEGSPSNPDAIGAVVWVTYAGGRGPARELQAGSGYWSYNGLVQVLGLRENPTGIRVRWPGGTETDTPVTATTREVEIRFGDTTAGGANRE